MSSSKIFTLTFYITDLLGDLRVERAHTIYKCSLSDLNRLIKDRLRKEVKVDIRGLAMGGHVSRKEIISQNKVIYGVEHINNDGEFDVLFGRNELYIRILTDKLSGADLVEVLRLGLDIEKYSRHFKKNYL